MLIVQVEPPQNTGGGDYFYRTYAPGKAMAQDSGVVVVNMTNVHRKKDHIMGEADVLVLVNICDPDILPLIRERKSKGKLTVYEIADDLGALQHWNPVYFFYQNRENLSLVYRLAACCDAMQVTVVELKRLYGHLSPKCRVFPNQISYVPPDRVPEKRNEVVIGWGGSHGHLEDMAEIAGPLIQWIMNQPNVVLHLMCSDPVWNLFEPLPHHRRRRTLPGSIEDYYRFLSQIDIGIAPLKKTAFNRSRSDIKFLEYAVSGVVPVMARLEPYVDSLEAGKTGFLFEDITDLLNTLNRLLSNVGFRQEIARAARQYVLRERLQEQHVHDRIRFYRVLLEELYNRQPEPERAFEWLQRWSRLGGANRQGHHLRLEATRFENLLHDGLVAMQMNAGASSARKLFEEAARINPENHLPYLFGASLSADPIASLRKAVQLKPKSVLGRIRLGEELAKQGKIAEALANLDLAARLEPDYEIPYLRAGTLLRQIGENTQAKKLFQKVKALDTSHFLRGSGRKASSPINLTQ